VQYHSAASIALFFGTLSWLCMAILIIVHAPAPVHLWPGLAHLLAVGLLAAWLWRSWLHVAWMSVTPHLLANLSCFAVVVVHNRQPAPWLLILWPAALGALSVAAAAVASQIRKKQLPDA